MHEFPKPSKAGWILELQFPNWKSSFRIQSKLLDQQPGTTGGSSFKTLKGNSAKNIWNTRGNPWTLRTLIMKSPKPENTETLSTNQHKGNLCKQMNHIIPTICFICFHHWENPRHEAVEIPRASVAATPGRLKMRFWEVKRFDSSMISWIKSKDFWTIIFVMFSLTPHVMFTVHTYSGLGKCTVFSVCITKSSIYTFIYIYTQMNIYTYTMMMTFPNWQTKISGSWLVQNPIPILLSLRISTGRILTLQNPSGIKSPQVGLELWWCFKP